jgi:hypothetical protein
MDNVVTVFHGVSVEDDEFENVSFDGMCRVPMIFHNRPLFSEVFGRARDKLYCNSNEDAISVEGVLYYGKSGRIFRWPVPIACEGDWEKYVKTIMKNKFQCMDLLVRKLLDDPTAQVHSPPNGHSPPRGLSQEQDNPAPSDPPLPNLEADVNVEDAVAVPDAQSAPNEVGICPDVGAECWAADVVTTAQEIPLTQNMPSKCGSNTFYFLISPLIPLLYPNAILNCGLNAGDIPDYTGVPPVPPSSNIGQASNSVDVEIDDDEEPYGTRRAVESDDDRPIAALSEEDMELIRLFYSDHDPLIHEFSDLSGFRSAYAEGRDGELLEAPESGDSIEIQKNLLFKDLPTLTRWLQEYYVKRKRQLGILMWSGVTLWCARRPIAIGESVLRNRRPRESSKSPKL